MHARSLHLGGRYSNDPAGNRSSVITISPSTLKALTSLLTILITLLVESQDHVPLREIWFEIIPWLFVIRLITCDESYHRVWNKVNCVYIQDY